MGGGHWGKAMRTERERSKARIAELEEKIKDLEGALESVRWERLRFKDGQFRADKELEQLRAELDAVKVERDGYRLAIQELRKDNGIPALESSLKQAREEAQAAREEAGSWRARYELQKNEDG